MTTDDKAMPVFHAEERNQLVIDFTGRAMQGILANPTADTAFEAVPLLSVTVAKAVVAELEDHFRKAYADKAAELKAAQEAAADRPLIVVPNGGGIIQ